MIAEDKRINLFPIAVIIDVLLTNTQAMGWGNIISLICFLKPKQMNRFFFNKGFFLSEFLRWGVLVYCRHCCHFSTYFRCQVNIGHHQGISNWTQSTGADCSHSAVHIFASSLVLFFGTTTQLLLVPFSLTLR